MGIPILGANTESAAYEIDNSLRFNDGDSARLTREFTQDPTSRQTFTVSMWVKRSTLGANTTFFNASTTNNFYDQALMFDSNDNLRTINVASGSDAIQVITNRKFRDVSSWYHIVLAIDTTQASVSNGVKFYINGTQETSFGTTTYNQGATYELGRNGSTTAIGRQQLNGTQYFDGYMAEVNYIDGQQLDSSYFGETNANGVWVPKEYTGTYGNNGFFLEFNQTGTSQNSSGIGADTSGNDEHFAVTNLAAIDVTTDTPTNNFATMNPLDNYYAGQTFSEGNCKVVTGNSQSTFNTSTIGVANGKWYWEVKIIDKATGSDQTSIGIQGGISPGATSQIGYNTRGLQLRSNGNTHTNGGNSTYMAAQNDNDIVMVAFDRDNNNVYFGANGQWGDGSGNTDEANPTSAKGISVAAGEFVFAALGDMTGSDTCTYEINFGQPSFSISSSNADANGHGNFEYAVPTGYFALCTKNLAENG